MGALAGPAAGLSAPAPLQEGWPAVTAEFSGGTLVWAESRTIRLPGDPALRQPGFPYWSVESYSVALRNRTFLSAAARRVVVRNQVGPNDRTKVAGGGSAGRGRFTVLAGGRRFAPPLIWCCTEDRGIEVVLESDGRDGGPAVIAASPDGSSVRYLLRQDEAVRLISVDPALMDVNPVGALLGRTEAPFPTPAPDRVAMAPGVVAWVDAAAGPGPQAVRVARISADGTLSEAAPLRQPGQVLRIWASRPVLAVAVRRGPGRIEIARHEVATGRRSVLWRGSRVPPVAIGGGAIVVADGRRVLGGRGARMRLARTAAGVVAALATDGRRVASFERIRVRPRSGPALRRTAVRLAAVR